MRITVILLALTAFGCTDEENAYRALRSQGMENIQFTGYDYFSCSEDDFSHTGFTATNPQGMRVKGTVCCGFLFKNCTVRW